MTREVVHAVRDWMPIGPAGGPSWITLPRPSQTVNASARNARVNFFMSLPGTRNPNPNASRIFPVKQPDSRESAGPRNTRAHVQARTYEKGMRGTVGRCSAVFNKE